MLINGFKVGFSVPPFEGIGCDWVENGLSVSRLKDVVRKKIDSEILEGRISGPFSSPPFVNFRLSPLSVVPKKEPNSYRLIHNLSHPKKFSLNDFTDKSQASVHYASFDDALSLLRKFGKGALMAKADIKSAFRLLPINPAGFNSLGFQFENQFYFDRCLPMGFTLSCFYFEAFSSFLNWVIDRDIAGAGSMHYLDDFLFVGSSDSRDCLHALFKFFEMCKFFGVPLAMDKTVFPSPRVEFLGIIIDSDSMEFLLPMNKINRIVSLLEKFLLAKKTTLRELQSLLGLLVFSSRVIPMGRVFCKRLFRSTCGFSLPHSHIRLTKHLKADLSIWLRFIRNFNGHSIWQEDFVSSDLLQLYTDAAGSIGFGVYFNGRWSAESWPDRWFQLNFHKNILLLELFPVLVAIEIWGELLRNKRILFHSDNKGVVFCLNCLSAKSLPVITVLRQIVLRCLELNIWIKAAYIPGSRNVLADCISRQQWDVFRRLAPEADLYPSPCPLHLWDILLT